MDLNSDGVRELSGAEEYEMSIQNEHRNAEYMDRAGSFNPNLASIIAFCHAPDFCDAPDVELDMFSRWIKLSDEALAAGRRSRKRAAAIRSRGNSGLPGRGSRLDFKCPIQGVGQAKSAGSMKAVPIF